MPRLIAEPTVLGSAKNLLEQFARQVRKLKPRGEVLRTVLRTPGLK
jgi:hypothetical protein